MADVAATTQSERSASPTLMDRIERGYRQRITGEMAGIQQMAAENIQSARNWDGLSIMEKALYPNLWNSTPEERESYIADQQKELDRWSRAAAPENAALQALPQSAVTERASEQSTFRGVLKEAAKDPLAYAADVAIPSLVQYAPDLPNLLMAGRAGGVRAAAATGGLGAAVQDFNATILDELSRRGVDTANPKAVSEALQNPDLFKTVTDTARARASIVGATGALGAGLASKVIAPVTAGPLARELTNAVAQVPAQAALAGAGEGAAQLASGQGIRPGDVVAEMVGGMATAPVDIATAAAGGYRAARSAEAAAGMPAPHQINEQLTAALRDAASELGAPPSPQAMAAALDLLHDRDLQRLSTKYKRLRKELPEHRVRALLRQDIEEAAAPAEALPQADAVPDAAPAEHAPAPVDPATEPPAPPALYAWAALDHTSALDAQGIPYQIAPHPTVPDHWVVAPIHPNEGQTNAEPVPTTEMAAASDRGPGAESHRSLGNQRPDGAAGADAITTPPDAGSSEVDRGAATVLGGREPERNAALTGAPIDQHWTEFSPESGTLSVPRAFMPQVKADDRSALVQFLRARGVNYEAPTEINPAQLRPTQAEFSPQKVQAAQDFKGGDRSILVSSDGYVIDGHHQWLANRAKGSPVKAIVLDATANDLLPMVADFPSASTSSQHAAPADQQHGVSTLPDGSALYAGPTPRQGSTVDGVVRDLAQRLGPGVRALQRNGLLNIVQSQSALPIGEETKAGKKIRGMYDRNAQQAYLVADHIDLHSDPDAAVRVVLHEIGEHHGLQDMLGPRLYNKLGQDLRQLKSESGPVALAFMHVRENYGHLDPGSDRFMREVIAQVGQDPRAMNIPWFKRAVLGVRRFLWSLGLRKVNVEDVQRMLAVSLERTMRQTRQSGPASTHEPSSSGQTPPPELSAIDAVQQSIRSVISAAKRFGGHVPEKARIAPVSAWLQNAAKTAGFDLGGFHHVIDGSAVRHIVKNHYDGKAERARGQLPVTDADLEALPSVVSSPERVVFGTKNRQGRDQVAYIKRMPDGSLLYLEEVRTKRQELAAVSIRKYPATMNADTLVSTLHPNAQGDGGNGLIVISPTGSIKGNEAIE